MIKQTLFFTNPVSLSLRYNQLEIQIRDCKDIITRPIEDIGFVIIDHPMTHITIPLLNALSDNNVSVIFCNDKCMPQSMLMPLDSNHIQQETYRFQLEASLPTKKRIWKEIIECKIRNQATLLNKIGIDGKILKPYYSNVLSGDSDNREGAAAKIYWKLLFGNDFVRSKKGDSPNLLLNYGYTILRAAATRALIGSGLFPGFGIFHHNRYNAFPLADDVMEPYRPFVDLHVNEIYEFSSKQELDKETKRLLVNILYTDVKMNGKLRPLQVALSATTASLVRALKEKDQHILYPIFV